MKVRNYMNNIDLMNYQIKSSDKDYIDIAIITDDIKCNDVFDEQLNLKKLRRSIDYRIEPHLIEIADYDNIEIPFVQEIIDTGIKVAQHKKSPVFVKG